MEAFSIRCPSDKKHGLYSTCGAFLGSMLKGSAIFYCSHCNHLWQVDIDGSKVVFTSIDKKKKLDLKDPIKLVE